MTRAKLSIFLIMLSMLACGQYTTPTPTAPASAVTPAATAAVNTVTPYLPLATLTPKSVLTATVVQAVVRLHDKPGDDPDNVVIGYLRAGDKVTVILCDKSWCKISTTEQTGYIYRGCLSENPDNLGCEAR